MKSHYDVLIVGAGLAGIATALMLPSELRIAVVCKGRLMDCASAWAQGGIAGVIDEDDEVELHVDDTLVSGAGLCDPEVVKAHVEQSAQLIDWLIEQGVPFTNNQGQLHLHREGGHGRRRIVHVDDRTGAAIQEVIVQRLKARENVEVFESHYAVDLIMPRHLCDATDDALSLRCYGAYIHDLTQNNTFAISANQTVLASGGMITAYRYSTNPNSATGDGIAMAWRAGCRVANMEFVQFHPTCLYHPMDRNFLITEAIRGEGGVLRLPSGERFMLEHHPDAELAPRDVVARAIDYEIKKRGLEYVLLDISDRDAEFLNEHFPTIVKRLAEVGIDMSSEGIPVVPAAHYTCGGVVVDSQGRTDVPALYCIGESTCTGLHGANRLASNSLLECLVGAQAAAPSIVSAMSDEAAPDVRPWDSSKVIDSDDAVVINQNWQELRLTMWNYVGIVRTDKRLRRALARLENLGEEINDYYQRFPVSADLMELRNVRDCAEMVVRSAMGRRESRGLHYNLDCPLEMPKAMPSILTPAGRRDVNQT